MMKTMFRRSPAPAAETTPTGRGQCQVRSAVTNAASLGAWEAVARQCPNEAVMTVISACPNGDSYTMETCSEHGPGDPLAVCGACATSGNRVPVTLVRIA